MKKSIIKLSIFVLILGFVAPTIFARTDVIGEIVYMIGTPRILRNSGPINQRISIGFPIENFDLVSVPANGIVEVSLRSATGFQSRITIRGGSTMSFDLTSLQSTQQGSIHVMRGTVSLDVAGMNRNSRLNVRTGTATMGVRGTKFDVTTAPTGEVLVSTSEGRVAVETDQGQTFFSEPGRVVQLIDERWAEVPVRVTDLETFIRTWNADRIDALRANFPRAVRNYASRYIDYRDRFIQAYIQLMSNRTVIQKWIREDQENRVGTTIEQLREKRQIAGALLDIRRVLFFFERIYYRVLELEEYFGQGFGDGVIDGNLTISGFFREVQAEQDLFEQRMQEIRYVNKLYALRNDGRGPLDLF